jgi:uncharacterized protein
MRKTRVAIIGAGPAGIAAAETLSNYISQVDVVIFDKGRPILSRPCPVDLNSFCKQCNGICNVMSGFGGCLQYGDAIKLSRYPAGRRLKALLGDSYRLLELEAINFFSTLESEFTQSKIDWLGNFQIRSYPVAEISEDRLSKLLINKYLFLSQKHDVRLKTRVINITGFDSGYQITSECNGTLTNDNFDAVIVAVGRSGIVDAAQWFTCNNIKTKPGSLSIGVRFELPTSLLKPLYNIHKDFKYSDRQYGTKIKSFCFSAHPDTGGVIKYCNYQDQFQSPVIFLDAHTNVNKSVQSDSKECKGNFALLFQIQTECSARDWVNTSFVSKYSKLFDGKPIWQPIQELIDENSKSKIDTSIQPSVKDIYRGNINSLLADEIVQPILSSYRSLCTEASRINGDSISKYYDKTIVMAPAVEFMWDTVDVSSSFETNARNFFVLGDCAGVAQGILQAAISGISAAQAILHRQLVAQISEDNFRSTAVLLSKAPGKMQN